MGVSTTSQSTWRKIQHLGLVNKYRDDEEVKLFCGMLDGLAFLPVDDFSTGMAYLIMVTPDGLESLVNYLESTYVSRFHFNKVLKLTLSWCAGLQQCFLHLCGTCMMQQYEESHEPTTREGWNNAFSQLVGHAHPTHYMESH